jgi:MOSC domain-containing protein YiiM
MSIYSGRVVSVNVGQPREIEWLGELARTSIWKSPVAGRVAVRGVNLSGDDQADRTVHGGPDKAIYSYAQEDEAWWAQQLGRPVEEGTFGENLTLVEVDVTHAVVGERWEVGSTLLEVSQPRVPCWKLGLRMNDPAFPPIFAAAGRPGAYLRIIREGDIGAGDAVRVISRPAHGITVGDVAHIYHHDRAQAARLLDVPELGGGYREWAAKRLAAGQRKG